MTGAGSRPPRQVLVVVNPSSTRACAALPEVVSRLGEAGVRGLHGGPERLARARKARLVEYAVAARLVTASDLELLPDASRA